MKIRQFVIAAPPAKGMVAGFLAVLLAACASESSLRSYVPQIVTPYRIDIQQGNFITPDMLQKLAVGQTREQVRFILGTPLLVDIFRANRWDYVFRSSKGWNEPEKRKLIVFFDASGRVERWEADLPLPAPAVPDKPVPDKPAVDAQPRSQAPSAVPVSVETVSGASNLTVAAAAPAAAAHRVPEPIPTATGVPLSSPAPAVPQVLTATPAPPASASAAPANAATAVFTQLYESDALKESGRKTLALMQAGGHWRIRDESFRK